MELNGLQADVGNAAEIVREGRAHVQKLLHPGGAIDANVQDAIPI